MDEAERRANERMQAGDDGKPCMAGVEVHAMRRASAWRGQRTAWGPLLFPDILEPPPHSFEMQRTWEMLVQHQRRRKRRSRGPWQAQWSCM